MSAMKFNALIPELAVSDFAQSLDFYEGILGFRVEYRRDEEQFAFLSYGESQIMVEQWQPHGRWHTGELIYPYGKGINFQIRVDNIAVLLASLRQRERVIFMEPEEKWYRKDDTLVGNRQFLVQDPDGYLLRFTEDLGERPLDHGDAK